MLMSLDKIFFNVGHYTSEKTLNEFYKGILAIIEMLLMLHACMSLILTRKCSVFFLLLRHFFKDTDR